jgi:membrane protein implicated in regulation of membrane protease activity
MSEAVKYMLIAVIVLLQLAGMILLFFNLTWAIFTFILYGVALLVLLTIFMIERRKEKKEEIDYDDCDY